VEQQHRQLPVRESQQQQPAETEQQQRFPLRQRSIRLSPFV
jgi:hypothetical protein